MKKIALLFSLILLLNCDKNDDFQTTNNNYNETIELIRSNDNYEKLKSIPDDIEILNGDLIINLSDEEKNNLNLSKLNSIKTINGRIEIRSLKELSFLNNLEYISGSIKILDNHLEKISLKSLKKIDGGIEIYNNDKIQTFEGFSNLEKIGYSITGEAVHLRDTYIKSFEGLEKIDTLNGDIRIINSTVNNFNGLNNLISLNGILSISESDLSNSFRGLDNLKSINPRNPNNIALQLSLTKTPDLEGFTSLKTINGLVKIGVSRLKNLIGFNNVEEVNGSIFLEQPYLQVVDTCNIFNDVKKVKGHISLSLSCYNKIYSFNKLENLEGGLSISTYNSEIIESFQEIDKIEGYLKIRGDRPADGSNFLRTIYKLKKLKEIQGNLIIEYTYLEDLNFLRDDITILNQSDKNYQHMLPRRVILFENKELKNICSLKEEYEKHNDPQLFYFQENGIGRNPNNYFNCD